MSALGLFAWASPALASMVNTATQAAPMRQFFAAPVYITKPTATPIDDRPAAPQPADDLSSPAFDLPTLVPTDLPILPATQTPTSSPEPVEASGGVSMEIVPDTPESPPLSAPAEQESYPAVGNGERWIDVDLSEQQLYAYEGDVIVNSFLVSTGLPATPTVKGRFKIWIKVRIQDMSGPGYYLPDVPYVMYFYDEYGLHGTYWHNDFGTPMSRGCVNLRVEDAQWLFGWASVGTVVNVHD